jgi:NADPH:quinone reductase-like Zn-dependent oxidoreductase
MVGGPTGRYLRALVLGPVRSTTGKREYGGFTLKVDRDDLAFVAGLLESGDLAPVIDRRYPLQEVPEAIRYLEDGRATGKVVITAEDGTRNRGEDPRL